MLPARRDSLLKDCSLKLGPKDLANLRTGHFDQQEVFDSDVMSQVQDNMIKRLSIIKESDTGTYRDTSKDTRHTGILPEILISGGHLTLKVLSQKATNLFVTNEHSQTPLMQISLRANRKVAEERGSDWRRARLQDFLQVR